MSPTGQLRLCVLTLCASRLAGGLFYSVRELSRATAQLPGCQVSVWCVEDAETASDLPAWEGLDVRVFPRTGAGKFGLSWALLRAIRDSRFDVVHVHGVWNFVTVAARLFQRRGVPVVISPRGMYDPWILASKKGLKAAYFRFVEKPLLRRCAFVHALHVGERDAVLALGPCNVVVAPNGVRCPALTPRGTRPPGREKVLTYVGRLHDKKGLVEFVKAWAEVPAPSREGWRVKIHGWGDKAYVAALAATIHASGLQSVVTLEGEAYGERKVAALTEADAFVLPTKSEGLPMAVLEAWSFGLPTLLTDEANLPIGFERGAAMRLGDPGGWPHDIAAFLDRVVNDDGDMRDSARALAEQDFRWEAIATRLMAHYRAAASRQSLPA